MGLGSPAVMVHHINIQVYIPTDMIELLLIGNFLD